jgi:butyryl-CoA dehydrogenase
MAGEHDQNLDGDHADIWSKLRQWATTDERETWPMVAQEFCRCLFRGVRDRGRFYESMTFTSLPAALVATQFDSAVSIIRESTNTSLRDRLLARIEKRMFVTIGIAQLTTSRKSGPPAVTATPIEDGYRIDGTIPWCTGASRAGYVVAGAVLPDLTQILFALPTHAPGVSIGDPLPLAAMQRTLTAEIACDGVRIPRDFVLAGPAANALATRKPPVPMAQARLALGHALGAIDIIKRHESERARTVAQRFDAQVTDLRERVIAATAPDADVALAPTVRAACADLALRAAHACVALYKGNGLRIDHPAQRIAREALFLLVWSCPDPVIDCTVDLLSNSPNR